MKIALETGFRMLEAVLNQTPPLVIFILLNALRVHLVTILSLVTVAHKDSSFLTTNVLKILVLLSL